MRSRVVLWGEDFCRCKQLFCGIALICALLYGSARAQTISAGGIPDMPDDQTGYFFQLLSVANNSGTNYPGLRVLVLDIPVDTPTNMIRVANAHGLTNL